MGCNCGKNKNYPKKKSSRMPMKKSKCKQNKNTIQENILTPNERRTKIVKMQNANKLKQIRKQQFEWESRANKESK